METAVSPKTFTCDRCRRESAIEGIFLKKKYLLGLVTRYYCPDCQLRHTAIESVLYFLIAPLLSLVLYFVFPIARMRSIALILVYIALLVIPIVVIHELSHAVVGRLLGFHVFGIQLGIGRPLFRTTILGLKWDVRAIPVSGFTFASGPPSNWYRLKNGLIYLAGPASHFAWVVMAVFCGTLAIVLRLPREVSNFFMTAIFLNLALLVGNLWPVKTNTPMGPIGSDGWQLLQIFSWKPEIFAKHYAMYYAQMALEAKDDNRLTDARGWLEKGLAILPDDPGLLNLSGYFYMLDDSPRQARQIFSQLLERPGLELVQRCLFLNNVAYADIVLDDPALLPEADRYSSEAYQHLSWEPAITGTRGLVLLMLGKPAEGLPLLYSAFKNQANIKSKAVECCYISIGEARLGNQEKAKTYLETARQLDPFCPILPRAERELAKAGLEN
jgi:tetratricopeptide (TPR) repeat protein